MSKTAVVAVGGNSLIKPGQAGTIAEQFASARETAEEIAEVVREGWRIALTHGNGPQVGFILLRSEMVGGDIAPTLSLDMCDADSQGGIGYILQQSFGNALRVRDIGRMVVAVVTQVEVDPRDPGFENPTKPIGKFYSGEEAERLRSEHGWKMVFDAPRGWRRVVPSPRPLAIVEVEAVRSLVEQGVVTICVGGGGIPVVRTESGELRGVEAVVDKDYASALLARTIEADLFVISTQVEKVALGFGTPQEQPLDQLTADEAERHLREGQFPPGSMGPKIEAAVEFVRSRGRKALITDFPNLSRALHGETGTWIVP